MPWKARATGLLISLGENDIVSRRDCGKKEIDDEASNPVARITAAMSVTCSSIGERVAVRSSSEMSLPLDNVMNPDRTKSIYVSLAARYGGSVAAAYSTARSGEKFD